MNSYSSFTFVYFTSLKISYRDFINIHYFTYTLHLIVLNVGCNTVHMCICTFKIVSCGELA